MYADLCRDTVRMYSVLRTYVQHHYNISVSIPNNLVVTRSRLPYDQGIATYFTAKFKLNHYTSVRMLCTPYPCRLALWSYEDYVTTVDGTYVRTGVRTYVLK